jgi:hypothetical protein
MKKPQQNLKNRYTSPNEHRIERMKKKFAGHTQVLEARKREYDPVRDMNAEGTNALATLFIYRISFDTSEKKLRSVFEKWGPIKR